MEVKYLSSLLKRIETESVYKHARLVFVNTLASPAELNERDYIEFWCSTLLVLVYTLYTLYTLYIIQFNNTSILNGVYHVLLNRPVVSVRLEL